MRGHMLAIGKLFFQLFCKSEINFFYLQKKPKQQKQTKQPPLNKSLNTKLNRKIKTIWNSSKYKYVFFFPLSLSIFE